MAHKKTKNSKTEALSLAKQRHVVVREFLNQEPTRTALLQGLINKRGEGNELALLTELLKREKPMSNDDMHKDYDISKPTVSNAARDVNEYLERKFSNIIEPLKAKRIKICVWRKTGKGGMSAGYHFVCFNAKTKKYLDVSATKNLFENLWDDFIRNELRKKMEQDATDGLSKKLQGRDDYQVLDMEIGVVPQNPKENEIGEVMDLTGSKTYGHNRVWESFNIDSLFKSSDTSSYIISVDAGGGKTTFLRYLQLEFLRKSEIIPIFLDASKIEEWRLENSNQLAEELAIYFDLNICKNRVISFLTKAFEEEVILLVDGLDQIKAGGSEYECLVNHILDLMGENVIITSRPSAVINQEDENQFTFLRLKPLDTNAQENYFGDNFERGKQLSMNASYLIAIPMLANMVRMLIEEKQDGNINNRAKLYEKFIGYILTKYKHGKAKLSPGLRTQIRMSLGKIAYDALAEKEPHLQKIPLEFCYKKGCLPDNSILRNDELLTKSGLVNLIIERSGWGDKDFLFFTHQSFQEYLAAEWITQNENTMEDFIYELIEIVQQDHKWKIVENFVKEIMGYEYFEKTTDLFNKNKPCLKLLAYRVQLYSRYGRPQKYLDNLYADLLITLDAIQSGCFKEVTCRFLYNFLIKSIDLKGLVACDYVFIFLKRLLIKHKNYQEYFSDADVLGCPEFSLKLNQIRLLLDTVYVFWQIEDMNVDYLPDTFNSFYKWLEIECLIASILPKPKTISIINRENVAGRLEEKHLDKICEIMTQSSEISIKTHMLEILTDIPFPKIVQHQHVLQMAKLLDCDDITLQGDVFERLNKMCCNASREDIEFIQDLLKKYRVNE